MAQDPGVGRTLPLLLHLAAFVVVIAGLRAAGAILVPFLLSIFVAVLVAPPVFWLKRKGLPIWVGVVLAVLVLLGLEVGLAAVIGGSADDFYNALPGYQQALRQQGEDFLAYLRQFGLRVGPITLMDYVDPGAAMRWTASTLQGLGAVLSNTFLIMLTVVFILLEASSFPAKVRAAFGAGEQTLNQFTRLADGLNRYMAIKSLVSLGTGLVVAAFLALLGIDFPLLWGILAFFLNFVPNIGSIIAAVPPVLLGLIQYGSGRALLAAAGFVAVNLILGNVVEPRYMGRGLGLSTLVVFLSLVFWGWVFGPVGMLLSVPLTMALKIALETGASTRWLAVLLGPEGAAEPAQPEIARS